MSLSISGGRIATPIYGHFAADVTMDTDDTEIRSDQADSGEDELSLRKPRRLPSPISEDEDPDAMLSPRSRLSSMSTAVGSQSEGSSSQFLTVNARSTDGRRNMGVSHYRAGSYDARTGITTTFSMGYRADCEKCVNKVPGHYAHVIRKVTGPAMS
jgi:hypothetical protein